jgi:hypothetical protein
MPSGEILSPARPAATHVFTPDDVRGAEDQLSQGQEVVVTRSHEAADFTVSIRPPDAEGVWRVGGRVWLLEESNQRLSAALMHGDHVLQSTRIVDGEYFELEDVLPRGWHLEIHLPEGVCVRVEDPRP